MINYGIEKFSNAARSLSSKSDWKDRLYNAFYCVHMVNPVDDLPPSLRKRFVDLHDAMTRIEAKQNEGNIKATVAQMDEAEGQRLLKEIQSIHESLRSSAR